MDAIRKLRAFAQRELDHIPHTLSARAEVEFEAADEIERLERMNAENATMIMRFYQLVLECRPTLSSGEIIEAGERAKIESARLRQALQDAIERPKGVVPSSADEFYDTRRGCVHGARTGQMTEGKT